MQLRERKGKSIESHSFNPQSSTFWCHQELHRLRLSEGPRSLACCRHAPSVILGEMKCVWQNFPFAFICSLCYCDGDPGLEPRLDSPCSSCISWWSSEVHVFRPQASSRHPLRPFKVSSAYDGSYCKENLFGSSAIEGPAEAWAQGAFHFNVARLAFMLYFPAVSKP